MGGIPILKIPRHWRIAFYLAKLPLNVMRRIWFHNKACSPLPASQLATHCSPTAWNAASRMSPSEATSSGCVCSHHVSPAVLHVDDLLLHEITKLMIADVDVLRPTEHDLVLHFVIQEFENSRSGKTDLRITIWEFIPSVWDLLGIFSGI